MIVFSGVSTEQFTLIMNINMKKIQYYISALLLVGVVAMSLSSCSNEKLGPSIFPDEDEVLDPTSTTYKLDKYLKENFLDKYNLTFLYKMPDISTNMNYNLVPADYNNSIDLAVLCKHLWFDVYDKVAGEQFLKNMAARGMNEEALYTNQNSLSR